MRSSNIIYCIYDFITYEHIIRLIIGECVEEAPWTFRDVMIRSWQVAYPNISKAIILLVLGILGRLASGYQASKSRIRGFISLKTNGHKLITYGYYTRYFTTIYNYG